jgi:hypothetical protein
MIIRATQKNKMSIPVSNSLLLLCHKQTITMTQACAIQMCQAIARELDIFQLTALSTHILSPKAAVEALTHVVAVALVGTGK